MFKLKTKLFYKRLPLHNAATGADVVAELLLDVLEHEGVVAQLAQLYYSVHERLRTALALVALLRAVREQHALRLHVSAGRLEC